jgi:hypothetical protein
MKIVALAAISAFLFQQVNGCEQSSSTKATPKPNEPPIRRFEAVVTHGTSDVALDTKTGQLCRTWDWGYKNNPNAADLNMLPTCNSIFLDDQKTIVVTPDDMKKNQ